MTVIPLNKFTLFTNGPLLKFSVGYIICILCRTSHPYDCQTHIVWENITGP